MMFIAKSLEALGIACVMIGLVQGLNSETMWMELYLFLIGMAIFGLGWWLEKRIVRKRAS